MPVLSNQLEGPTLFHSREAAVYNSSGSRKRSIGEIEDLGTATVGESSGKMMEPKFFPRKESEDYDDTELNATHKAYIVPSTPNKSEQQKMRDYSARRDGLGPSLKGRCTNMIPEKNKIENFIKGVHSNKFYGENQNSVRYTPYKNPANKHLTPFQVKKPSLLTFSTGRKSLGMNSRVLSQMPLHQNTTIAQKRLFSQEDNDDKFEISPCKLQPLDLKFSSVRNEGIYDTETTSSRASSTSYSNQTLEAHKIGFKNLGNTCYMNSSVQSLLGLGPFCSDVEEELSMMSIHLSPLQALLRFIKQGNEEKALGALKMMRHNFINFIDKSFNGDKQQDASEFLNKLLGQISEDIIITNKKSFNVSSDESSNLIEKNFEVITIEKNTCKSCEKARTETQKHLLLYLSLPTGTEEAVEALEGVPVSPGRPTSRPSVQALLEEVLGPHRTKCSHCEGEEGARDTKLAALPRVLILQLKRYNNNSDKIMTPIKISPYLELDKFVMDDCSLPKPAPPRSREVASQTEPLAAKVSKNNVEDMSELERVMQLSKEQQEREQEEEERELQEVLRQSLLENSDLENLSKDDVRRIWAPPANVCHLYRLVSIILHSGGGSGSGHYVAQVYRSDAKAWFHYSDRNVYEMKPNEPLGMRSQKNCYLLFYMHRDIFQALEDPAATVPTVTGANGVSSSS